MYRIDYNIDYIMIIYIHILQLKHFLFTSLQQLTCSISICIYVFFFFEKKNFVICFQWCFRICNTQRFQFFSEIDYRHWSSSWIYSLAKDFQDMTSFLVSMGRAIFLLLFFLCDHILSPVANTFYMQKPLVYFLQKIITIWFQLYQNYSVPLSRLFNCNYH